KALLGRPRPRLRTGISCSAVTSSASREARCRRTAALVRPKRSASCRAVIGPCAEIASIRRSRVSRTSGLRGGRSTAAAGRSTTSAMTSPSVPVRPGQSILQPSACVKPTWARRGWMTRITAPPGAAGSMPHPALPFNTVFNYPGFVPDARERRAGVQRDDRSHADHIRAARSDGQLCPKGESFQRDMNYIPTRITREGEEGYPVEAGRYRLAVARACPWANRAVIDRRLLGLEDALSMAMAGPTHDKRSWTFDLDEGGRDPVLGIERLQEAYFRRFPDYDRGITVPAVVDTRDGAVVTNDFQQMTLDLITEWTEHHREGAPDLYPRAQRAEIDALNRWMLHAVNNGVYKTGFAGSQAAYEKE